MESFEDIEKLISSLIRQLKIDVKLHPFFIINEHDLQAYLYSRMVKDASCNRYVKDDSGYEVYLVHCEYTRGYMENNKYKKIGKWDIALLDSELIKNVSPYWDEMPVFSGFELKLNINGKFKRIKKDIEKDQPAVESIDGENDYATWGVLFHVNIGKKEKDGAFEKVRDYIQSIQKENRKSVYVYLEFYEDNSEPQLVFSYL